MLNNNQDIYIEKYIDILDLFCYNSNSDKLCNNLSYDKNGYCKNCKNCIDLNISNKQKKELFLEKKDLIVNSIKYLLTKCETTIGKINKAGVVLEIYEIIFYNIFFIIIHPKFLITNINKIDELYNKDIEYFTEYINQNKDKEYIYNFMHYINNFVKFNKYDLNVEMSQETYDNFLSHFVIHMKEYYNNIINEHNNSVKEIEIPEFDINYIEKYVFCLDI